MQVWLGLGVRLVDDVVDSAWSRTGWFAEPLIKPPCSTCSFGVRIDVDGRGRRSLSKRCSLALSFFDLYFRKLDKGENVASAVDLDEDNAEESEPPILVCMRPFVVLRLNYANWFRLHLRCGLV